MSTEFSWDEKDFEPLLAMTPNDEAVKLTVKHIPGREARILEAGSGNGRVVKYLYDLGFHNTYGIELNRGGVELINKKFPELKIIQGDILKMPYEKNFFDLVAAYGLVEHFIPGLNEPLKALYDVLKPGGIAIITVPSLNIWRRIRRPLKLFYYSNFFRRNILKKPPLPERNKKDFAYYVHPVRGDFFEYRLKPSEFKTACQEAGFKIIASLPIYHLDGLYHDGMGLFAKYENCRFIVSPAGKIINRILKLIPFFHNHMHACVLQK
jgi:Methylase involved in ubiquinone/menaquinone biosynthesis